MQNQRKLQQFFISVQSRLTRLNLTIAYHTLRARSKKNRSPGLRFFYMYYQRFTLLYRATRLGFLFLWQDHRQTHKSLESYR